MEAKDTVMSGKEIDKLVNTFAKTAGYNNARTVEQVVAFSQAEISFKEGMKEVVEWIEKNGNYAETSHDSTMSSGEDIFGVAPMDWQAKLKEWGIG